jgi:hypothetical protein
MRQLSVLGVLLLELDRLSNEPEARLVGDTVAAEADRLVPCTRSSHPPSHSLGCELLVQKGH